MQSMVNGRLSAATVFLQTTLLTPSTRDDEGRLSGVETAAALWPFTRGSHSITSNIVPSAAPHSPASRARQRHCTSPHRPPPTSRFPPLSPPPDSGIGDQLRGPHRKPGTSEVPTGRRSPTGRTSEVHHTSRRLQHWRHRSHFMTEGVRIPVGERRRRCAKATHAHGHPHRRRNCVRERWLAFDSFVSRRWFAFDGRVIRRRRAIPGVSERRNSIRERRRLVRAPQLREMGRRRAAD